VLPARTGRVRPWTSLYRNRMARARYIPFSHATQPPMATPGIAATAPLDFASAPASGHHRLVVSIRRAIDAGVEQGSPDPPGRIDEAGL